MELVIIILNILLVILFFIWLIFKILNIHLVMKFNCKELYKNQKRNLKKAKISKILFIIILIILILIILILIVTYLINGFMLGLLFLFMSILNIFKMFAIYPNTDNSGYRFIVYFTKKYVNTFSYSGYVFCIVLCIFFIRLIYINVKTYKFLKNNLLSK